MRRFIIFIIFFLFISNIAYAELNHDFRYKYKNNLPLNFIILGDSTSCGYGANDGINTGLNGLAYGYDNYPDLSPNWTNYSDGKYIEIGTNDVCIGANQSSLIVPGIWQIIINHLSIHNPNSNIYNYSISGGTANSHITANHSYIANNLNPKPEYAFLMLGINSAKNHVSQTSDLQSLINSFKSYSIEPIIIIEHNIAMDSDTNTFWGNGSPNNMSNPLNWVIWSDWSNYRNEMKSLCISNNITCIDTGDDSSNVYTNLMYDPFHRNKDGYALSAMQILSNFSEWKSRVYDIGNLNRVK